MTLILASASPQRSAILRRVGLDFTVRVSGVSELEHGDPEEVAAENALRKALAVRAGVGVGSAGIGEGSAGVDESPAVLGVDTLVELHGQIYGKPTDAAHARATLQALSGATHRVLSGIAVLAPGGEQRRAVASTEVSLRTLDERLLDWYLATEEWRERAGGYAIQGAGALLVRAIVGDYENVVGLPLATLLDIYPELLEQF